MRVEKENDRSASETPKTRNLTVYYKMRERTGFLDNHAKEVPEIRLCGNWLQEVGFLRGRKISITATQGKLVIQLQPE